jgi:broad specificity phosphatase PhoE
MVRPSGAGRASTGAAPISLTDAGVAAGQAIGPQLSRRHVAAAFSSPLTRAMRTADLAGLVGAKPDPDLLEWDYGGHEGKTEEQIRGVRPGWDLWRDGVIPGGADHPGETLEQVAARTDAVLSGSARCCATATSPLSVTVTCSAC